MRLPALLALARSVEALFPEPLTFQTDLGRRQIALPILIFPGGAVSWCEQGRIRAGRAGSSVLAYRIPDPSLALQRSGQMSPGTFSQKWDMMVYQTPLYLLEVPRWHVACTPRQAHKFIHGVWSPSGDTREAWQDKHGLGLKSLENSSYLGPPINTATGLLKNE